MIFNGSIRDDLDLTIRSELKQYTPEASIEQYGAKDSTEIGLKFKWCLFQRIYHYLLDKKKFKNSGFKLRK